MFNIWKIATFKGPIPDNCNAIWNNDVCQRSATPNCRLSIHGKPAHPAKDEAERCRSYYANIAP